jgi:hypothetical protein
MMFERHIDFEYDDIVLIKSVKDLNLDNGQVLTHSNGLAHSNCLIDAGIVVLDIELFVWIT